MQLYAKHEPNTFNIVCIALFKPIMAIVFFTTGKIRCYFIYLLIVAVMRFIVNPSFSSEP